MRKTITIIFMLCGLSAFAQNLELKKVDTFEDFSNEYLDTLTVKKKLSINDYTMVGVHYGVGLSQVMWNPTQKQDMMFVPVNFGVSFTKYGKMFGYMPFFGLEAGLLYTKEGYQFEKNEKDGHVTIGKVEGAEKAVMEVIEAPVLMVGHFDLLNFKIMAKIGCYAGYRLSIKRYPGETGYVRPDIENSFLETDRRIDYGLKGGFGFGLVFDPVEIHFEALYKHSLSSLYDPDYYSEYYYRFAFPSNITITAGLHFHLSKRSGRTKADIKNAAKEIVYGKQN